MKIKIKIIKITQRLTINNYKKLFTDKVYDIENLSKWKAFILRLKMVREMDFKAFHKVTVLL